MSAHTNGIKRFLYVVQYDHKFGTDAYVLRSDHDPSEDEVVDALRLDFEPEKNESLLVTRVSEDSIIELPPLTHKP